MLLLARASSRGTAPLLVALTALGTTVSGCGFDSTGKGGDAGAEAGEDGGTSAGDEAGSAEGGDASAEGGSLSASGGDGDGDGGDGDGDGDGSASGGDGDGDGSASGGDGDGDGSASGGDGDGDGDGSASGGDGDGDGSASGGDGDGDGSASGGDGDSASASGGDGDSASASGGDGDGDTNTDTGTATAGDGDGDGGDGDGDVWQFDSIYGVPNLDNDDQNNSIDWNQAPFDADDDYSTLTISAEQLADFAGGDTVRLTLGGDTGAISVWRDGEVAVGAGSNDNQSTFTPGGSEILLIEFATYLATGTLTLEWMSGGNVNATDSIDLMASPLIMNHHLQTAERVWAVAVNNNDAFIDGYQAGLGSDFSAVSGPSYGWDVWIQDEVEFATSIGSQGQRLNTVIDSIRDRGLDDFPEDYFSEPDFVVDTWGSSNSATTYDSFGNLEASPPVTVGDTEYPFGRIYYGRLGNQGMDDVLANFLDSQSVQAPFEVDTTWLCVGHVDEFSSWVPDPSSAKGFKFLFADVDAAYDILDTLPTNTSLPQYWDHGYGSVGQIVGDNGLRALNADIQTDILDPIREQFKTELGLTEADILRVPTVFEEVGQCGGGVVAMTPGMVNLIVANMEGQTPKLFIPDPFLRSNTSNQAGDPLIDAMDALMPDGLDTIYLDNWDTYHVNLGEVHCGTNVLRTPMNQWWTDAMHLIP